MTQAARVLKGDRTKTIGLIIPSMADPFFSSCAEAAQAVARGALAHLAEQRLQVARRGEDVEIPEQMQRAMARQAEAERERRAKIINSEGEYQAAEKLAQAADIISKNPATLQLRYLQTLLEMGVNQNTTIVFPLPIDLIEAFTAMAKANSK